MHIRGRGGKTATDPLVVASNETAENEPISKWRLKRQIGVSIDDNGSFKTGFKRPKMSRKRQKKETGETKIRLASMSQNEQVKRRKQKFLDGLDLKKKKFRDALKLRLITQ